MPSRWSIAAARCAISGAPTKRSIVSTAPSAWRRISPTPTGTGPCSVCRAAISRTDCPAYEWRWRRGIEVPRNFAQPLWRGEDLTGKTILLHAEQGFGDSIQMLRYLPMVAAKGAKGNGRIVLEVPDALMPLIADPNITLVRRGAPLPSFDVHCPLMSLPLAFGTTLATIPATVPYLKVPAERLEKWRGKLAAHTEPAGRPGLVGQAQPHQRPQPHHRAVAAGAAAVGAGRALRQPAARIPRQRPQPSWRAGRT